MARANALRPVEVDLRAAGDQAMPACVIVIFGGSGDLSHRKLLPALYNLGIDGRLPDKLAIVGFSTSNLDDASFRAFAKAGTQKFSRRPLADAQWTRFESNLFYQPGSFTEAGDFRKLRQRIDELDKARGTGGNRVYYLAIPPQFIDDCTNNMGSAQLVHAGARGPFSRLVVEKPIGRDLASAEEILARVARHFHEGQTFRIDHYLGKETVQNLLVLRLANKIFEPLWNSRYVDHVQITVAEQEGVGTRAAYYEGAGALRDMVQNHLLQLLCMIAMEPPRSIDAEAVRDAKLEVLRSLKPLRPDEVARWVVRGQYVEGLSGGEKALAYRAEKNIAPDSRTDTFVALKCSVENWRWSGVPFYLRTGKRLPVHASEITVHFKPVPRVLFNAEPRPPLEANVLTIRIQPDEGLALNILSKVPGVHLRLSPVEVDFHTASGASPEAYETLLRDVMIGDQTLFMRRDSVEAAWEFVQHIIDAWAEDPRDPFTYPAGSWGPTESALMIAADGGRGWRTL